MDSPVWIKKACLFDGLIQHSTCPLGMIVITSALLIFVGAHHGRSCRTATVSRLGVIANKSSARRSSASGRICTRCLSCTNNADFPVKKEEVQPPKQAMVAFHLDENGDWVAELQCGHFQHVRHNPPMCERPWVLTKRGRDSFLGYKLSCKKCLLSAPSDVATPACKSF